MNNDSVLLRLRLARTPGIGPRGACALVERAGGIEALFGMGAAGLKALGVPERFAPKFSDTGVLRAAEDELALLRQMGARLVVRGGAGYPEALESIHDPPQVLTFRGDVLEGDARAVAIVGARRGSSDGCEVAYRLAAELSSEGVTVVSGLARGIDRAAHLGALEAGGRTIAVLGGGLRRIFPPQNRGLAERVVASGALVSEQHPDAEPRRHTFPQRNRIIAGLSLGVVVVQAGPRSGALITADLALSEGRELFAVPGSIRDPLARGPNALIKDGARLVESADDVLSVLFGVQAEIGPDQAPVLDALRAGAETPDAIALATGEPLSAVLEALGRLELAGRVSIRLGGRWRVAG